MKTFSLLLLALLTSCLCFGQKPLTNSRISSYYTYIYRLSDADMAYIYESKAPVISDKILHTPVDSILTDKYRDPKLPPGNYVKVYAQENKLNYEVLEIHSAFLKLLDNEKDLRFVLLDKSGVEIKSALPSIGNNPVAYDAALQLYHGGYNKKSKIIKVSYQGVLNYFNIAAPKPYRPRFWVWFKYNTPVKYAWRPIENLFRKKHHQRPAKVYDGFVAFNKPKYKPGDTIKYKAYIYNIRSRKPVTQKTLYLRIRQRNDEGKLIGTVSAYRDGFYEGVIPITDSLKLELDEDYNLSFEKTPKFDEDNDYYADESKNVYISGRFTYEEYELKAVKFNFRSDVDSQTPGKPISLYLKATDENDLPVADGRVNLTFTTYSASNYYDNKVFVPDTLWIRHLPLDAIGETKVVIPDSIFPKADISFRVDATFLNSNNEERTENKYLSYKNTHYHITTAASLDTLKITYDVNGKNTTTKAWVAALSNNNDTLSRRQITLPAQMLIDPVVARYDIKADSATNSVDVKAFSSDIATTALRTADSVFIRVNNPRRIPFWYTIFSGNKAIEGGKAVGNWQYNNKYGAAGNMFLRLNYIWGGEAKSDEVAIAYRDKLLSIVAKQPATIYPGQQLDIEYDVNNAAGKPMPGVDLTAYAFTSKFEDVFAPSVPYFGKRYPPRKRAKISLRLNNKAEQGAWELNWERWGRQLGLDTIAYFQFTHPKNIYTIQEPAAEGITQIAPFVMKDGVILPVHILFIDNKPVYFSQAQQLQRYSFKVSPGRHVLKFRTAFQTIRVDSDFVVPSGKKTILSINATDSNPSVKITNMPMILTPYEADLINRYMIVVNDNFDHQMATLSQDDNTLLLNPMPGSGYRNEPGILTGPLRSDLALLSVKKGISVDFLAEPNYNYLFTPGLLKQKSISGPYAFSNSFIDPPTPSYRQSVLTPNQVDTLWQQFLDQRAYSTSLFNNEYIRAENNGKLTVELQGYYSNNSPVKNNPAVKNVIMYREGNPDFLRIYPGSTSVFGYIEPGKYRLLYLFVGDRYHIVENVVVKAGGINYYHVPIYPIKAKDSVSIKINDAITSRSLLQTISDDKQTLNIKEAFNQRYLDNSSFADEMSGTVIGKGDKETLPGVSVMVKGTRYAAVTDINGHFHLHVPPHGKLVFAYIGFEKHEAEIVPGANIKVALVELSNQLNEVVVVGYGTSRKADITGSVSTISSYALEGKVAGVMVRGSGSISNVGSPLYVIDGELADANNIDPSLITEITILKDASATALYGARAANGVIVISTKKGKNTNADTQQPGGANTLRTNFRNYAYWQPRLTTNAEGKAVFKANFPDDITNWRTQTIAIGGKYTGYFSGAIKAYKPVSASMVTPQFAIKGDEMNVLGKVMNYTTDVAKVDRRFSYNGDLLKQANFSVKNSLIDTFRVTAAGKDSLKFEYTIKKESGYFDGERRGIPLFEQGVQETKGSFADLEKDTTLTLKFDPALGKVTFRAESSVMPALLEEADHLRNYEYLCNEQLASKLKGLLAEKRIRAYLGQEFKWDRNVRDLIKKLQDGRRANGTWGWWKDTPEELWISVHAMEALADATKEGYTTEIDKQKLIDYLVYQASAYKGIDKLDAINLLFKLGAKADYPGLIAAYERSLPAKVKVPDYDKLKLMLIKQQAGLPVNTDSLFAKRRYTMFGNIYWGEDDSYRFFDNAIQLSVMAYHIFKAEGRHPEAITKLRNYFLEQRHDGYWRNTYESSLILETILPDLLIGKQAPTPPAIALSGSKTETVDKFPYTTMLDADASLTIHKTGVLPVYITGYQQFWNKQPVKVSKDFTVNTWFEKNGNKVTKLTGGEAVELKAEVIARADADFVMVEIPIPAGCSYESKEQSWWGNEVHREYFKNKVSIFCRKLSQGKYTFTIRLMPRYGGNYTLNPAKAEMMYFPVFYGRDDLKRVTIN